MKPRYSRAAVRHEIQTGLAEWEELRGYGGTYAELVWYEMDRAEPWDWDDLYKLEEELELMLMDDELGEYCGSEYDDEQHYDDKQHYEDAHYIYDPTYDPTYLD